MSISIKNNLLKMYAYIQEHSNDPCLLFETHPYLSNDRYFIILGLYIYGNITNLSEKLIDLADTNLSKLWCAHYNPTYTTDINYDNYKASLYAYKHVYLLSYNIELDIYIDPYTNKFKVEHFKKLFRLENQRKVCLTKNGLVLYECVPQKTSLSINYILNTETIYTLAIHSKNYKLFHWLTADTNKLHKLALVKTMQHLFNTSNDTNTKKLILLKQALIAHRKYKLQDIKTVIILDLTFDYSIKLLEQNIQLMKDKRTSLPLL